MSRKKDDEIKFTAKDTLEQKNALQLKLNRLFRDVVNEKHFEWMKAPLTSEESEMKGNCKKVYKALRAYETKNRLEHFQTTRRFLPCDFVMESQKLIIEYDERQHFTKARSISLQAYKSMVYKSKPLRWSYSIEEWMDICRKTDAHDRDSKISNRDTQRAYYDAMRDICAAENGYKLIRIRHKEVDFKTEESMDWLKILLKKRGISISFDCINCPKYSLNCSSKRKSK